MELTPIKTLIIIYLAIGFGVYIYAWLKTYKGRVWELKKFLLSSFVAVLITIFWFPGLIYYILVLRSPVTPIK